MGNETKLDRFVGSFKSEADLRRAILGLLERMPNAKNVRLTHGTAETGKDIVFHFQGPFAQLQVVACVIKNQKITGSADSDDGARAVYHQAEQSLDTPIPRVTDGRSEPVSQVFVICPHECPPATIDSIKGRLQARPGQVTFLCGRELLQSFEDYCPEFLTFQSGLYGSYIADLQKRLDSDPAVANVLFRHGFVAGAKPLTGMYVRPKFQCELHQHQLKATLPDPEHFRRSIGLETSQELQASFREIGRLVWAIRAPSEEGDNLQATFYEFAERIKESWQKAFEAHRRRSDLSSEERTKAKNEVLVELTDRNELASAALKFLQAADHIIKEFGRIVDSSNKWVEHQVPHKMTLASERMLDYCQVVGVSKQAPASVGTSSTPHVVWELGEDLVDTANTDLFISGPAGFGKTSFCKWQTLFELKRFQESQSNTIPIYIPLHQHAHGQLGTFQSTFLAAPELTALWERRSSAKEPTYKFRLYLDGLDEVPSIQRQKELLELAFKGKEAEPTISIIVTGREHVVGTHLRRLARVRVREFDDAQIREFTEKWFESDEHLIREFSQQLEKVASLRPLMRVPLLATLMLGVYRNSRTLPQSRVSLYEMFVGLLAGGWDIAKNIQRQARFGPAAKLTVLTKLAATAHKNRRRDCSQGDFKNAVMRTLPGLRAQWQEILEETIHDGLLIPVGIDYAFAHLSFQEYLSAKDLFEPNGRRASFTFKQFLEGDDWWREVAAFYVGLASDPKEMEEFVRKLAHETLGKTADESVKARARFLLETLLTSFPGAQPMFSV